MSSIIRVRLECILVPALTDAEYEARRQGIADRAEALLSYGWNDPLSVVKYDVESFFELAYPDDSETTDRILAAGTIILQAPYLKSDVSTPERTRRFIVDLEQGIPCRIVARREAP